MANGSMNPTSLGALDPKVTADNGGDFSALLQPKHQVAFVAVADPPTAAQVTAIRDALVHAGIMKAA